VYNTAGTYDVTLEVGDGSTTDTEIKTGYIIVSDDPIYCDAGSTGSYEYIDAVSFNTISTSATGLGTGGYQDHTSEITDIEQDQSYTLDVTLGSPYAQDQLRAWIDWNQDGDFEDTGEQVYESSVGTGPYSGSITVPSSALTGNTRMRIRVWDTSSAGANDTPCGDADWGEVEDYTVNITSAAALPPTAGFSVSSTEVCEGGSFSFTDTSTDDPTGWDWDFGDGNTSTTQNPSHSYAAAGTYTVSLTATNANGSDTETMSVTVNPLPTASVTPTDATCNGSADGSVIATSAGGTAPYTYLWGGGETTATITGLNAGTYNVTVTDANGCVNTSSGSVSEPAAIVLTPSSTDASCGNSDGTASIAAAGGTPAYTYLWSTGATTDNITAVAAGSYTVTVTDANGCSEIETISINDAGAPMINAASTNVTCFGDADGTATAIPSGGTSPYTYLWSTGGTTDSEADLAAGTYTITITDDAGCVATESFTITEPTELTTSMSSDMGWAIVTASGGTPPYSYLWSSGETTESITAVTVSGDYTVTVTDANGCTAEETVTLIGTGIENMESSSLTIYPNPASDKLYVKAENTVIETITIMDASGRIIFNENVQDDLNEINISDLVSGMYFIQTKTSESIVVNKFIKR
jgi:PKD repeat protein